MLPNSSRCLVACLALACGLAVLEAKPIWRRQQAARSQLRNSDHQLLAVASENQQIEYVEQAAPVSSQYQSHNVQYVYQVEPELDPRGAQYMPLEQHQPEPAVDYPGEVIYSSQNGQIAPPEGAYAVVESQVQTPSAGLQQPVDPSARLPDSSLAATILTEVPLRDLPYDVLENLKREYGVKVVATRERPGADLMINCDEQSNQYASLCLQQQPQDAYAARNPSHSHVHSTAAPQDQSQNPQPDYARYPQGAGEASPEAYNGEAATREAEESYGYRSSPATTEATTGAGELVHANNSGESSGANQDDVGAQTEPVAPQEDKVSEAEKPEQKS